MMERLKKIEERKNEQDINRDIKDIVQDAKMVVSGEVISSEISDMFAAEIKIPEDEEEMEDINEEKSTQDSVGNIEGVAKGGLNEDMASTSDDSVANEPWTEEDWEGRKDRSNWLSHNQQVEGGYIKQENTANLKSYISDGQETDDEVSVSIKKKGEMIHKELSDINSMIEKIKPTTKHVTEPTGEEDVNMDKPVKNPEDTTKSRPENKYTSKKKAAMKENVNASVERKSRSKTRQGDEKTNKGGDDSFRQAIEKEIQRTQMLHPHESDEDSVETTKGSNVYKQRYSLQLHPHPSNSHADTELMNTAKI